MKKFAWVALAVVITLCGCPGSNKFRADLSDAVWLLAGPFPNASEASATCPGFFRDWLSAQGREEKAALAKGAEIGGRTVVQAQAESGIIDLNRHLGESADSVAYAYLEFASGGGEYALRMGSDDGIRAWLNGSRIVDDHVHRSMNPGDEAVPVQLSRGRNRLLVKVDQGYGEWSLSCTLAPRGEEERAFAAAPEVGLSITVSNAAAPASEEVAFTVHTAPAFAVSVPVECILSDPSGREAARMAGTTNAVLSIPVPAGAEGMFTVSASAGGQGKLAGARASASVLRGETEAIFTEAASRARSAAGRAAKGADAYDFAPTLEFLADTMEGKAHPGLSSLERKMRAAGFAADIVDALGRGERSALQGYRQYAYRSSLDGSLQPYSLYVPEGFDPARKYSLIIDLHGFSSDDYSAAKNLADLKPKDFIIASPYGRGDLAYVSAGEQDVLDVMDRVMAAYPIYPDRVYLTGNSMGGMGAWRIAQMYPDRFAAVAPFCGWTGLDFMSNLLNLSVLVAHGDSDPSVPVSMSRDAVAELKSLGVDVRYDELAGGNHDAWRAWFASHPPSSIFDYFRSKVRNPSPRRIAALVPCPRYGRHYWISVDELAAGSEVGSVIAVRDSGASVSVKTGGVSALSVDLALAGLADAAGRTVIIDGTAVSVPKGATRIRLWKDTAGSWRTDPRPPAPGAPKHDGGGLADLFMQPLRIVYGTQSAGSRAMLEEAARRLADWSPDERANIGDKTGRFIVRADTEITETELSRCGILLLGKASENLISRRAAGTIGAYYRKGAIFIGGASFPDKGLFIVRPSPFARGRLMGYIDIPPQIRDAPGSITEWFYQLPFRLRDYRVDESVSWPQITPDVAVLDRNPLVDIWAGRFDRNWEDLK